MKNITDKYNFNLIVKRDSSFGEMSGKQNSYLTGELSQHKLIPENNLSKLCYFYGCLYISGGIAPSEKCRAFPNTRSYYNSE
jgi:hypothetical protein